MEIIFALMVLGATPFGAALLADKPTKKRVGKFVDVHWLTPLEQKIKPKSLAPTAIPADFTGVLEKRDKNWEAENKLCVLWQDAFDWFSIPDVGKVLEEATTLREEYKKAIAPHQNRVASLQKQLDSMDYRSRNWYREDLHEAKNLLNRAEQKYAPKYTEQQKRVLAISDKYGWEQMDNGLIRTVNKGRPLAVDPIVYAL